MNQPNRALKDKLEPKGTVYRRLYDSKKLKALLESTYHVNLDGCLNDKGVIDFEALCAMAFDLGLSKGEFQKLLDNSAKKMFAGNFLWKFFRVHYNKDIVIPFLTGYWTTKAVKGNLIVTTGHAGYAGQIGGVTSTAFTAVAYGTGTTAAAAGDTALQTETARGAATVTRVTTSVTNDTSQWVKTFTAGGTQAITEEGILDNNASGGNLLAHQVFSAVNMVVNDTLQFTHKIQS
jgi:hypothetical protein